MQQLPPFPDEPPEPSQPGQPSESPPEQPVHTPDVDVPSPGTQPPTTPISPVS
jgi:hypothetical protein